MPLELAYVRLFDETGYTDLEPGEEPRIDAAVSAYLDSGESRDTLMHLTTLTGAPYVMRASRVHGWCLSTPETRRRGLEIDKALSEEDRALRAEVGMWDDA